MPNKKVAVFVGVFLLISFFSLVGFVYKFFTYRYPITNIALPEEAPVFLYLPKHFIPFKQYPVFVALHGMEEEAQKTCEMWQELADTRRFILLCPGGSNFKEAYTRSPIDDRARIITWFKTVQTRYRNIASKTILAGFSRGGNIALELGLKHPDLFPNVLCIFGFFNPKYSDSIYLDPKEKQQKVLFVTGKKDLTKDASYLGFNNLKPSGIQARIWEYPYLKHDYPKPFLKELGLALDWFYESKIEHRQDIIDLL